MRPPAQTAPLNRFTQTAQQVAGRVIKSYSTSFGLATRLLGRRHRTHIRNIYALVRVADEIVDGVANAAGLSLEEQHEALDRYEHETHQALRTGYSTDLVVHAFAHTARLARIDESLTSPFFASMRSDLDGSARQTTYDQTAHANYVYGSAEVVGLMCLQVFLRTSRPTADQLERLQHGARQLGAAFQNINFLRDLGDDTQRLGRGYLGVSHAITDNERDMWVQTIRKQMHDAAQVTTLLPSDVRTAVRSATGLFSELTNRVARTPAAQLHQSRIRVPDPVKLRIIGAAIIATQKERLR
ncbi:Phytoene/squalene synthetase [Micrococcales bacterium KH10]|nr:Phytoene/squalene synthetase [Micrococcales bacterium KH10]